VGYDQNTDADPPAGYYVPGQYPQAFARSERSSFQRAWTTKCTQCHFEIHGSDLPSQAVPGKGKALTR
jgi:hypothetical protein